MTDDIVADFEALDADQQEDYAHNMRDVLGFSGRFLLLADEIEAFGLVTPEQHAEAMRRTVGGGPRT